MGNWIQDFSQLKEIIENLFKKDSLSEHKKYALNLQDYTETILSFS